MWEKRREKEKKQEKRLFSGMKILKKSLNRNINLLSFIFFWRFNFS